MGSNPTLSAIGVIRDYLKLVAIQSWLRDTNQCVVDGEVLEWTNRRAWKARVPCKGDRGFESHPLRHRGNLDPGLNLGFQLGQSVLLDYQTICPRKRMLES